MMKTSWNWPQCLPNSVNILKATDINTSSEWIVFMKLHFKGFKGERRLTEICSLNRKCILKPHSLAFVQLCIYLGGNYLPMKPGWPGTYCETWASLELMIILLPHSEEPNIHASRTEASGRQILVCHSVKPRAVPCTSYLSITVFNEKP